MWARSDLWNILNYRKKAEEESKKNEDMKQKQEMEEREKRSTENYVDESKKSSGSNTYVSCEKIRKGRQK